jgi:hypothetical protein
MDKLLEKIIITIILLILKIYIDLDFISHSVDNIIIAISALSWDFNPFTSEITKFFNGNSGEEGEGSNRQNNNDNNDNNNNNTPNQDTSINPEEVKEVEGGVVVSGKTLEELKALYEKSSETFEKMDTVSDKSIRQDLFEKNRQMEEVFRILEERQAEMKQRIRDFYDLKNQGESEESLSDIQRQLVEDSKSLHEDSIKLMNKIHSNKEVINKKFLDSISKYAQKIKDITKESNSK